ncbi:AI-2 transport protein TqsA [Roseivivax jejudonensis]|uniref:AI-2 transport protein TqsA n=1 Tax=Roseivivax jejudonensis TaxID=1529041 RepID=A0A1X7AA17_9RHOB|nr:AI-2E family transporter [Roseivivax jejudonensis]SLN74257.1 AI-2 transport protein TqsA [Roseivivax jejudonensis]
MASTPDSLRIPLVILATVAAGFVLYVANDIIAPMTLAVVIGVIVAPVMDVSKRIGLPEGLAATLILIITVAGIAALGFALEPLFWRIVDELPSIRLELRALVYQFQGVIQGIDNVQEEMKQALGAAEEAAAGGAAAEEGAENGGGPQIPTLTDAMFLAPIILGKFLIFVGTFYFFLVTRHRVYSALAQRMSQVGESTVLLSRFHRAEYLVSRYFVTISIINVTLGFALAGYLMAIGLPLPLVWGAAAAILNFVLYVGPAAVACGLLLSGLINFDGLMVLAPAFGYLCINMTEAQFVTPSLVGRHVALNPLLVFSTLCFGIWFWGPIGGIVAIPVIVIVMALLDDPASRTHANTARRAPARD